jgi:hypothetical protein
MKKVLSINYRAISEEDYVENNNFSWPEAEE